MGCCCRCCCRAELCIDGGQSAPTRQRLKGEEERSNALHGHNLRSFASASWLRGDELASGEAPQLDETGIAPGVDEQVVLVRFPFALVLRRAFSAHQSTGFNGFKHGNGGAQLGFGGGAGRDRPDVDHLVSGAADEHLAVVGGGQTADNGVVAFQDGLAGALLEVPHTDATVVGPAEQPHALWRLGDVPPKSRDDAAVTFEDVGALAIGGPALDEAVGGACGEQRARRVGRGRDDGRVVSSGYNSNGLLRIVSINSTVSIRGGVESEVEGSTGDQKHTGVVDRRRREGEACDFSRAALEAGDGCAGASVGAEHFFAHSGVQPEAVGAEQGGPAGVDGAERLAHAESRLELVPSAVLGCG